MSEPDHLEFRGRMMLPDVKEEISARAFDPKRPKLDIDDIRARVKGRYVVHLPQLHLLMDAYDLVSRIAPAVLREKLVGDLENRANQIAVDFYGWDPDASVNEEP